MMPTVSIITPCYNSQETISATIDSVLGQDFQDWEMIIVDDCSTDNSVAIIQRYMQNDQRIILLQTEKASGSPTLPRNVALRAAKGRFVAFLDSDDLWYPQKLSKQLATAKAHNTPFVFSNYEKMNALGELASRIVQAPSCIGIKDMYYGNPIGCLTVMLDISVVKNFQFKFIGHEDCVAWIEILQKGIVAYNTNSVEAVYRESINSVSSNKFKVLSWQWNIYRTILKFGICKSAYYYIHYAVRGLIKFKI